MGQCDIIIVNPVLPRERSRISGFCYALAFLWGAGVLLRCLTKKNEDKGPILVQSKYRSVYLQLLQTRFRDAIFHKLCLQLMYPADVSFLSERVNLRNS